jgi:hypothetical protein
MGPQQRLTGLLYIRMEALNVGFYPQLHQQTTWKLGILVASICLYHSRHGGKTYVMLEAVRPVRCYRLARAVELGFQEWRCIWM